ncbi:hypothetical protein [Flagellimonas sp.]|uniref:hypothetical protein n=1 Tax=Flagellimonas sp. TaxID=2058762 RepID=UPI003AB6F8C3
MSLIQKLSEVVDQRGSHRTPEGFVEHFGGQTDLFLEFGGDLHNVRQFQEQLEKLYQDEKTAQMFNPLDVEKLMVEALTRLERCMGFYESHLSLKKEVNGTLEKLFRIDDFEIADIEQDINALKVTEPRDFGGIISKTKLKELLVKVKENTSSGVAIRNQIKSSVVNNERSKKEYDWYLCVITGQNSDVIAHAKKKFFEVQDAEAHLLTEEALLTQKVTEYQAEISLHKFHADSKKELMRLIYLENKLESAKELYKSIVATHANGGSLDINKRWNLLVDYYQRDFVSAFKRMMALKLGWELIFEESIEDKITHQSTLSECINTVHFLIDRHAELTKDWKHTIISISLKEMMNEKEKEGELKFPVSELILESLLGETIILICQKNLDDDELPLIRIFPPKLGDYEQASFIVSTAPTQAIASNGVYATKITNMSLQGNWRYEVLNKASINDVFACLAVREKR